MSSVLADPCALLYEPKCGGRGRCWVSANEYSFSRGAQINFGDLTPYLSYAHHNQYFNGREYGMEGWVGGT
jgi:hypothetical protein